MQRSLFAALIAVLATSLVAVGCGDDDGGGASNGSDGDGRPSSTPPPDEPAEDAGDADGPSQEVAAYCDATLTLETLEQPDYDLDIPGAAGNWVTYDVKPVVDEMVATAPAEIADDLATLSAAVDSVAESSDLGEFGAPDVNAAEERIHAFDVANCGWQRQEITMTEYEFEGAPDQLAAQPASFELDNSGAEVHELVLQKKNEGVTESAEELAQLPPGEAASKLTDVNAIIVDPGESDYMVVDLEPGDYVMVCFVPAGTVDSEEPGFGDPHHLQGMLAEFTVS